MLTPAELAAGVAHQVVLEASSPQAQLDYELIDGLAQGWTEQRVKRYIVEQTYRPFDLHTGPMMRVSIVKFRAGNAFATAQPNAPSAAGGSSTKQHPQGEVQYLLIWTMHHIAVDLWSMILLMDDLKALYSTNMLAASHNTHASSHTTVMNGGSLSVSPAPALTPSADLLQYLHCIPSQLSALQGPKAERLWSYWLNHLAEPLPVLQLPIDKPRPAKQTYNGTSYTFPIPSRLHASLALLAREEGVRCTLSSFMFSSHSCMFIPVKMT